MDDLDRLELREELSAPARIAASRRPVGPVATGRCLNCDEIVSDHDRWCDANCRQDWEKQQFADRQRRR